MLRPSRASAKHDPYSPGLHHFCLRVDSPADVYAVANQLRALGVNATEPKLYPEYASDYVATFFQGPDGIRLEVTNIVKSGESAMITGITVPANNRLQPTVVDKVPMPVRQRAAAELRR